MPSRRETPDTPSTPAIRIRPARAGEGDAIRSLVRRAYAMYVARMDREPGPMLDDYAARIAEGAAHVLEIDGALAGAVVLLPLADGGLLLDNVAVDPEFQGRGLGRALVEFAEDEARRRGHRELRLYTHETMVENVAMYETLGYEETHRVTEKGYARIYMRKQV